MMDLQPLRGDWYQSKKAPTRICCKEYTNPPGDPVRGECVLFLPPGTWFGPVHEVQNKVYGEFVAVKVPSHILPDTLVWINIENEGTRFAERGPRHWAGFLD